MSETAKKKKRKRSFRVYVDHGVCDGCGVCVFYCKPAVFEISGELNSRGVFPALVALGEACTDCGLCEAACPQLAIAVVEAGKEAD